MKTSDLFAARAARLATPVAVFLVMFALAAGSSADEPQAESPNMEGIWQLDGRIGEGGAVNELEGPEAEALILKIVADGRWCVAYADSATDGVRMHHGGTYTLIGSEYTETIEFACESTRTLVDKTFKFNVEVEGETLTQNGIGNPYNEVWKRAKKML